MSLPNPIRLRVQSACVIAAFSLSLSAGVFASPSTQAGAAHDAAAHDGAAHDAAAQDGAASHGEHGHVPQWSEINWYEGVLGEKEGQKPNILWRAPGTPVPLLTLLLNTAVLFFLLGRIARPAIKGGLKSRKERIAGDIEFASKMKADAEIELGKYESKLEKMESEMQRIQIEMREQAESERERILLEAKQQREALERDAHQRISQELAEAKKEATRIALKQAILIARDEIQKNITQQDQEKLATDLLGGLDAHFKKGSVLS